MELSFTKQQPQRCYWRNLSKRSVRSILSGGNETSSTSSAVDPKPVMSESISLFQALEVRHEPSEEQKTEQNSMYQNCDDHDDCCILDGSAKRCELTLTLTFSLLR